MKFFIPDKIVLSLKSLNNIHYFTKVKKYRDYVINFKCDNLLNKKVNLNIVQYFSDGKIKSINLPLNSTYTCSNYYLQKISLKVRGDYDVNTDLINIEIIETTTNLEEISSDLNPKLIKFIEYIENNKTNYSKKNYSEIKLATILDEFSFKCFEKEANCINLNYETCLDELKNFLPDILFVESVWNGASNSWEGKIRNNTKCIDNKLLNLVSFCKQNNITTIFWNKEDLVNFEYFKSCSSIFDYIFVTDENIIPNQIKVCNHENVHVLEFAAQPKIHNSINKNRFKLGRIAFAGAWYGNKHSSRISDCNIILKPSLDFNLDIFDRNYYNQKKLSYFNMYWPEEYHKNIIGNLPYEYIVFAYKNYDLFLNVNSVKDSNTMVSRRIYEILASKTPILSSYSDAIKNKFRSYVHISMNKNDTKNLLNNILNNNFESRKTSKKSQRFVLDNHTYKNRLEQVFDTINLNYTKKTNPKVCIIGVLNKKENFNLLYKNIISQSYTNFTAYILVDESTNLNDTFFDNNHINISYSNLLDKEKINKLICKIYSLNDECDYFTIFKSNVFYGENYIKDYINILQFVNADIIGKNHILLDIQNKIEIYDKCDEYMDSYCNSIFTCSLFIKYSKFIDLIKHINLIESKTIHNLNNFTIYSDDEFNIAKSPKIFSFINV